MFIIWLAILGLPLGYVINFTTTTSVFISYSLGIVAAEFLYFFAIDPLDKYYTNKWEKGIEL